MRAKRFELTFLAPRVACWIALAAGSTQAAAAAEAEVLLRPAESPRNVEYKLQVEGRLRSPTPEADEPGDAEPVAPKAAPMRIRGEFRFHEQVAETSSGEIWRREYEAIDAEIQVGERTIAPTLRDEHRQHALAVAAGRIARLSPAGPMTREEDQLVAHVFDTAALGRIFPADAVGVGDSWPIDDATGAMLLGLDHLVENELTAKLVKAAGGSAEIRLEGSCQGQVLDAESKIEVRTRIRYDLAANRIVWVAAGVKEQRAAAAAAPGVDAVSTITIKLTEAAPVSWQPPPRVDFLAARMEYEFQEEGVRFAYDPRWRLTSESPNSALFRMIDDGQFVAQGRIVILPRSKAGTKPTLQEFQTDVRTALGERFVEFAAASERTTATDAHLLECTALGLIDEVSIQWMYYLATSRDGRRVAFTFTAQPENLERLAAADSEMPDSVRFVTLKVADLDPETRRLNLDSVVR